MAVLPFSAILTPATGAPIYFHGFSGWIDGLSFSIDRDVRPGQNGSVAQTIGKRAIDSQCVGIRFFDTFANAKVFIDIMENAQSQTNQKLLDQYLRIITVRLIDALCEVQRCRGPANGNLIMGYKVTIKMTFERMPDA